jgi:16S rRNA (uracil1498-N3)-methyltransferase
VTHRFFVDEETLERAVLRGDAAHQIAKVLRLRPGDVITLLHAGVRSAVVLDHVEADEVTGRVIERRTAEGEPHASVTVALPILRGQRTEEVIEAVTQLGVSRVVPFVSARSVLRTLGTSKLERWRRIARESAETARRGRVPDIHPVAQWPSLFEILDSPVLVAWEREALCRLQDAVRPTARLSVVIGPEGGFAADEIDLAREHGATTVSLGPRNLRSETAAIAAVAQVMATLER